MSGLGSMRLVEVCALGQRITVVTEEERVMNNGEKRKTHVARNYFLEEGIATEELTYFQGKVKKRIPGKSVSVRSLFPNIKHVYDKNGVLIARRNHPKAELRCTAKGMGRVLQETNKRSIKTKQQKALSV